MLVSIGLPTYNRVTTLDRAIRSALAQDHDGGNVELVISDNASTDGTEALCREWSARDPRVRYIRQPTNIGLSRNFEAVLEQARGEYFMWLSDDDWLDPTYVRICTETLHGRPDLAIAAGLCLHYFPDGRLFKTDVLTNLLQPSAEQRILAYFGGVNYNSIVYGVMRTDLLRQVGMPNALANDWTVVAWMLLHGKAVTVESTRVHRTIGGTSKSVRNVVRVLGLPWYQLLAPEFVIARNAERSLLHMRWPGSEDDATRRRVARDVRNILILRRTKLRRYIPKAIRLPIIERLANPRPAARDDGVAA